MPENIMRLSCPNCGTEYQVPDAALVGRSRKLRCANCGREWQTEPLPATTADGSPAAPVKGPFIAKTPYWPTQRPMPDEMPQVREAAGFAPRPAAEPVPPVNVAPPPVLLTPVAPPPPPAPVETPVSQTDAVPVEENPAGVAPKRFGQPVDDEAHAEFLKAVSKEQTAQRQASEAEAEAEPAAEPNAASGDAAYFLNDTNRVPPTEMEQAAQDSFAELVHAARNKSIEFEPDEVPSRINLTAIAIGLVVVVVILAVAVGVVLKFG